GEGRDDSRQDAGQGQRKVDAEQTVQRTCAQGFGGFAQTRVFGLERQPDRANLEREGEYGGGHERALPIEDEAQVEGLKKPAAQRRTRSKSDQEQIAHRNRRQNERQIDDAVHERLAGKVSPGEQYGAQEGKRQIEQHGGARDLQAQDQRLPFRIG